MNANKMILLVLRNIVLFRPFIFATYKNKCFHNTQCIIIFIKYKNHSLIITFYIATCNEFIVITQESTYSHYIPYYIDIPNFRAKKGFRKAETLKYGFKYLLCINREECYLFCIKVTMIII